MASSQLTVSTGRSLDPLKWLGFAPVTAWYWPCVTSVTPRQNGRVFRTRCWGFFWLAPDDVIPRTVPCQLVAGDGLARCRGMAASGSGYDYPREYPIPSIRGDEPPPLENPVQSGAGSSIHRSRSRPPREPRSLSAEPVPHRLRAVGCDGRATLSYCSVLPLLKRRLRASPGAL